MWGWGSTTMVVHSNSDVHAQHTQHTPHTTHHIPHTTHRSITHLLRVALVISREVDADLPDISNDEVEDEERPKRVPELAERVAGGVGLPLQLHRVAVLHES